MSAVDSDKPEEREAPDLSFLERAATHAPEIPNLSPGERGRTGRAHDNRSTGKVLTVGRGISVTGQISECDTLVVEGTVDADMASGHTLDIAGSGRFNGHATVDEAVIAGTFDGELSVRGKLCISANGLVTGTVRYGRLEIESGGELNGDVSVAAAGSPV